MVLRIPILGLSLRDTLILLVICYGFLLYEREGFRKRQLEIWDKILGEFWSLIQKFFHLGSHAQKKEDPHEDMEGK